VGQAIVNREQRGRNRAGYDKQLIESQAARLTAEFTKGFQSGADCSSEAAIVLIKVIADPSAAPRRSRSTYQYPLEVDPSFCSYVLSSGE
jgi:hypothetical protein